MQLRPVLEHSIDDLVLCLVCFRPRGTYKGKEHRCRCVESDSRWLAEHWEGYDIPALIDLCSLCLRDVVKSGSRWTWYACPTCREVNSLAERSVGEGEQKGVPLGRHSLMNGIRLRDPGSSGEFFTAARHMRTVSKRLSIWRQQEGRRLSASGGFGARTVTIPLEEWLICFDVGWPSSADAYERFIHQYEEEEEALGTGQNGQLLSLRIIEVTDSESAYLVKGSTVDELLEVAAPRLIASRASALVIEPDWPRDTDSEEKLLATTQIDRSDVEQDTRLSDWLDEQSDLVEYGRAGVISPFERLGINIFIGRHREEGPPWYFDHWEAFVVVGEIRLLAFRDHSNWERVWARFGFTNVDSRVGGYWQHIVGLVATGVAAIARDEDEEGRMVELLAIDDEDPEQVAQLIRRVEREFSQEEVFPEELIQSHIDGRPLESALLPGGFRYELDLDVDDEVVREL